jgi:hypothetical protein
VTSRERWAGVGHRVVSRGEPPGAGRFDRSGRRGSSRHGHLFGQSRRRCPHSWDEYAAWHLGLTDGANEQTKARYAFVYGDFRRVHRTGLIACVYRAAEWRHKQVELAAHELLQYLDGHSG